MTTKKSITTKRALTAALAGAAGVALLAAGAGAASAGTTAKAAGRTAQQQDRSAVKLFSTHLPPLATIGGVTITGAGYGSSLAPKPRSVTEFYGLTDRGPNVDAPNGDDKVEPLPAFQPSIGLFRFTPRGDAVLERKIGLKDAQGNPYNGQVNPDASTDETITDLNGTLLPPSTDGYDSEGLVAMPDGTFYVSDEYGPFVTHFNRNGRQIGRFSPFDSSLPVELRNRVANKGMEGLTLTPDGRTLVGIMQNTLANGISQKKAKNDVVTRVVTFDLRTHKTHEYLYLLDSSGTGNSEITALNDHQFLVDERDGAFPSATGDKKLWKIDLRGATDVGPASKLKGAVYDASAADGYVGLTVGGKSIEALTDGLDATGAAAELTTLGITPAVKPATPYLDVDGLLTTIDPTGTFFDHDKIEGVAQLFGGRIIVLSNDSDFGISDSTSANADGVSPPFQLVQKVTPAGVPDDGQYLAIDMSKIEK